MKITMDSSRIYGITIEADFHNCEKCNTCFSVLVDERKEQDKINYCPYCGEPGVVIVESISQLRDINNEIAEEIPSEGQPGQESEEVPV